MHTLQVITHVSLFQVQLPATTSIFFHELLIFVNFDLYDTEDFTIGLFGLETDFEPDY